ncbi:MAG: transketolase [Candidatus Nealsonbacteria bacterium DGGOD1a]|jgi:Transketolase, N-terminal subunit|nr:MAG: transketolase [Candidatus Nealsonbacteria bacterium DGGOD1a]
MDKPDYKKIANDARIRVLEMIYKAQTSHIGSNYSCVDMLAVIFENIDLDRDKVILSKGWAAASLYYFLKQKGRITEADLDSFCQPGSKFIGLAEPIIPEIPAAGGSMGFGLPFGVGFALAKKTKKESGKIFAVMSDGEMQIGTTWESALIARQHGLDNLLVFVDSNGLQAMGGVDEILNIEPLGDKWRAFGWNVREIDGHDFGQIEKAINEPVAGKPTVAIAKTVKGKGVSFMEGQNLYHYKAPSEQEYQAALKELKTNG